MAEFYRRDGSTFDDFLEASMLLADYEYRKVAFDAGDGWCVSTVFLVIPHPPYWDGHPSLYETLVNNALNDDTILRWPNEVAALAGHDQWVTDCRVHAMR
jgi:hypothetical protein